jgi:chaperonin GroES
MGRTLDRNGKGAAMTLKSTKAPTSKTKAPASRPAQATTSGIAIRPLSDRVLVQALDAQETLKSGIIIPDTAKERPTEGRVIAVGPGRMSEDGKRIAPEVKKGDTILYGKYSGAEIKLEGKEYLILRETDILAIL